MNFQWSPELFFERSPELLWPTFGIKIKQLPLMLIFSCYKLDPHGLFTIIIRVGFNAHYHGGSVEDASHQVHLH